MIHRLRWLLLAAAITACLALGYAVCQPEVQLFIENSGVNIPTGDVLQDYVYGIAWGCALLLLILLWPVPGEHKRVLALSWIVRCFVTLVVMLPYEERYYGLDCWTYFQRSHLGLAELLPGLSRGGTEIVVAAGALHLAIGPDSYQAMKISFAMAGFIAIYLFYLVAEMLIGYSPFVFWCLTLYPSVLFWSSILGKDPLILAAIAVHVWGLANVVVRGKNWHLVTALIGIIGASAIRIWMGPILLIPCLLILGVRIKSFGWRIAAVGLVTLGLAVLVPATIDRLQLEKGADLLESTRNMADGFDRANSSLHPDVEINSLWDLLLFTPESIFAAYFRPLPGDVSNVFGWLAGIENLGLLLLCGWALLRLRFADFREHLFLWGISLLLAWGLAYSAISYRDLGSAVRYKLQILPVLGGMAAYLCRRRSQARALDCPVETTSSGRGSYRGLTT